MKWMRLFYVFLLIPSLMYAGKPDECVKLFDKGISRWNQYQQLIKQITAEQPKEKNINLIDEAITCCQKGIEFFDAVLERIADKPKSERKAPDWVAFKNKTEQVKNACLAEMQNLRKVRENLLSEMAYEKAIPLYQESVKKAELAKTMNEYCQRRFNNVEEVVVVLNESARLCEEAVRYAHASLDLINPFPGDESKKTLRNAIQGYQEAAFKFKKEAHEWPEFVKAYIGTLKEQLATFRLDAESRTSYEGQKQAAAVLEKLVEASDGEEKEAFKEELAELQRSIEVLEMDHSKLDNT